VYLDSQGSADTSRSQHTDVTSEIASVHDKIGNCYCMLVWLWVTAATLNVGDNQNDYNDGEENGSSFSFVRSDSVQSNSEHSSGDEDQPTFSFIKDDTHSDDVPSITATENITPELSKFFFFLIFILAY